MNGIAHCVEALYAQDANPVTSLMAEEGIRALAQSLPTVVREPQNLDARGEALYGAWLAGASLGAVGMALHHKLCHTLGGRNAHDRAAARDPIQRAGGARGDVPHRPRARRNRCSARPL
jgi:alcohol dehydrogenase class IV